MVDLETPDMTLKHAIPASKKRKSPIKADLSVLDGGTVYRGSVDGLHDWAVRGWCLNVENPLSPVLLYIYLGDVHIGTTLADLPRPDLSEVLKFPVKAGYEFSLADCASALVPSALKALGSAVKDNVKLAEDFVHVRVADVGDLPYFNPIPLVDADYNTLAAVLQRKQGRIVHNTAVRVRDDLLNAAPIKPAVQVEDVNVVAYYLPQFHPTPENNEWWGEGFTEWTNVSSAKPSFANHHQPRLPADFGYYDLRLEDVQAKQVDMAKTYGISAFCYYYYWFSGTTMLTMPIDRHVEQNYDLDFCLCWANENWSRRWDGSENDVLMGQEHTEADDEAFIDSVVPYFQHDRYIKIDGAPFLMVYRPKLMADAAKTVVKWRERVRAAGFPDLHICMAETFGAENPYDLGMNSSVQFPPHGVVAPACTAEVDGLQAGFKGQVYDYVDVVASEIARPDPAHLRFRTAMPSWDNTARKGLAGHVFHNASPEMFETWLSYLTAKARRDQPAGLRYVFINAWNEWAEGAYLEPDRRHGHDNLKAVRNALSAQNALVGEALLPDAIDDPVVFKSKTLNVVTTLSNANKQMLKLLNGRVPIVGHGSPFVARPKGSIGRFVRVAESHMYVDTINGRSNVATQVTHKRAMPLQLSGWLTIPDVVLASGLPLFVHLVALDGDVIDVGAKVEGDYIATVYDRRKREDVIGALGTTLDQIHGYYIIADVSSVAPGRYRLGGLFGAAANPSDAYVLETDITLHIG